MTNVCLFFKNEILIGLGKELNSLSVGIPTAWSDDEDGKKIPINEDQLLGLASLFAPSAKGGFLHGRGAKYAFTLGKHEGKVFVECENDLIAEHIFVAFTQLEIDYGYACQFSELEHRNRVVAKKSYGQENIWVGRSFVDRLPGLYWLNAVPRETLDRLAIAESDIEKIAKTIAVNKSEIVIVKLYNASENWSARASELDTWCEEVPGCFSKAEAQHELDEATTFMEASEIGRRWK